LNSFSQREWASRYTRLAIVAGLWLLFILILAFVVANALGRRLDKDENQFVSAGALLLRCGLLPYHDYPFFHFPNLAFIYAALFATNQYLLLTSRCFNAACAGILLVFVVLVAARRLRSINGNDWLFGVVAALILSLNPFFRFTVGRAWNHDLPLLASVAALLTMLHAFGSKRPALCLFACGALLGLAIGTRLTFAPLPAAFILAVILFPNADLSRVRSVGLIFGGLLIALVPTITLFVIAPHQFLFDNFIYNGPINLLFRQIDNPAKATFLRKAFYPVALLAKSPSTLALVVGFAYFGIRPWYRAGWRSAAARREIVSIALILPFLFLGSWAPTPSYKQYYYAFVPFLLLGNIYGLAREHVSRPILNRLMLVMVSLSIIELVPDSAQLHVVFHTARWESLRAHEEGLAMGKLVPAGPVLTLNPIIPLEGGLTIYKELANGPFAFRTAALLDEREEVASDMLDPDDLDAFLKSNPPTVVMTSRRPKDLLNDFVHQDKHNQRKVINNWALWLQKRHEVEIKDEKSPNKRSPDLLDLPLPPINDLLPGEISDKPHRLAALLRSAVISRCKKERGISISLSAPGLNFHCINAQTAAASSFRALLDCKTRTSSAMPVFGLMIKR
jgi:hypothetical protein